MALYIVGHVDFTAHKSSDYWGHLRNFPAQSLKNKKNLLWNNFLQYIFLIFFQKYIFYVLGWNFPAPHPKNQRKNLSWKKWKNILYFLGKKLLFYFGLNADQAVK